MNNMEIFENKEFGKMRIIEENGKYLFCGTDVAKALGYGNAPDALSRHCKYIVKRDIPHPQSRNKQIEMVFIPEGDVYRLITHSKLPSAERFETWAFDKVLPAIRKHGAYITDERLWEIATSPEALHKLTGDLIAERKLNNRLTEENRKLHGKAQFFDYFIEVNACTNLRETAKELAVSERRLARFLIDAKFAYRAPAGHLLPYAKPANEGLFIVRDYCRNGHCGSYMLITPQGKMLLRSLRYIIVENT